MVKPNLGAYAGAVRNSMTFARAYAKHSAPSFWKSYRTTGNNTPFTVKATVRVRGKHKGERVLKFMSESNRERACAYRDCWGHKTNCQKTHIDCYTQAL